MELNTPPMTQEQLTELVHFFESKKASDIIVLDLSETSTYFNYFMIVSANSSLHLRALVKEFYNLFHRHSPYQGKKQTKVSQQEIESGWFIIDLVDIVVHIFLE